MNQHYTQFATLTIGEVMPVLKRYVGTSVKDKIKADISGHIVKVNSVRLQTFATRGTTCSCCGLEATHFAVETNADGQAPHLNLRAVTKPRMDEAFKMLDCPEYAKLTKAQIESVLVAFAAEDVLFTHDHTLARSAGGRDHISNTTTMCSPCNYLKSLVEQRAEGNQNESHR